MRKFHYATVRKSVFLECSQLLTQPDSFIAMDAERAGLIQLLNTGYRFVRLDDEWAIFEKEFSALPATVEAALDDRPKRFTNSVPFTINGKTYVQIGDASGGYYCLAPLPGKGEPDQATGYQRLQFILDALNEKDLCKRSSS